MKNTSKILALVLIVMTLLMGLSAITASAEEAAVGTTVYFQNNWLWTDVRCHYWGDGVQATEWPGAEMTLVGTQDDYDVYSITLPAGVTGIVITGIKNDGSGALDKTPNIETGLVEGAGWKMNWNNGNEAVAFTYAPSSAPVETTYTVAGNAGLCGVEWAPDAAANDLTAGEDGVYSITYTGIAKGTYEFKVVRNHSWAKAWPASNYSLKVPHANSTVTIKFNPETEEVSVDIVDNGHTEVVDAAVEATCTAPGKTEGKHCSECEAVIVAQEEIAMKRHSYVKGVCSVCEAKDETYVEGTYVLESSHLDPFGASEDNAGKTLVAGTDGYFTIYLTKGSKVDSSSKTWAEDVFGANQYKSGQRLYLGGKMAVDSAAIKFTTSNSATVYIWWVSNGAPNEDGTGSRPIGIIDAEGNVVAQDTQGVAKNAVAYVELKVPAAGTYYLGNLVDNNYFFKVVVVEDQHVCDYAAKEEITVHPTCATAGVKTLTCSCGATKTEIIPINPDAHYYVLDICYFCFDVKPSIVVGENTVVVPPAAVEGGTAYKFGMVLITEAGTYEIKDPSGAIVCIFTDSIFADTSDFSIAADGTLGASWNKFSTTTAELAPGYYYIGVYGEGEHKVTLGIAEEPAPELVPNVVGLGDNVYHITEAHRLVGYEFILLDIKEAGTYVITGGAPMTIWVWYDAYVGEALDSTAPYEWNVNKDYTFKDSFSITLSAPGYYWIGFRYDSVPADQTEVEFNISLQADEPADEPADDPADKPAEPQPELTLWEKIVAFIMSIITKIRSFLKI